MSECCANCRYRIRENGIDYCTLYRYDWEETTLDDYCSRWIYDESEEEQ